MPRGNSWALCDRLQTIGGVTGPRGSCLCTYLGLDTHNIAKYTSYCDCGHDAEWLRCGRKLIFLTGPYRPFDFTRVYIDLIPILYIFNISIKSQRYFDITSRPQI